MTLDETAQPTRTSHNGLPHWLFDDGTLLPVISGGDGTEGDPALGAPPATPPVAPASDDAPAGTPEGDDAPAGTPEGDQAQLSEEQIENILEDDTRTLSPREVKELRRQLAGYRQDHKLFKSIGTDAAFFRSVIAEYAADPTGTVKYMHEYFGRLLTDDEQEALADAAAEVATDDDPDDDKPLTRKELEAEFARREAELSALENQSATEQATKTILSTATELGYTANSRELSQLLATAQFLATTGAVTDDDPAATVRAAHDAIVADLKKVSDDAVQAYLNRKKGDASSFAPIGESIGGGEGAPSPPKSFAEARERTLAMLNET